MVQLAVINTKLHRTYIMSYKNEVDALIFTTKLYHIPPQDRYCIVMYARCTRYYEKDTLHKINSYINGMLPSYDLFVKYKQFPVYIKEVN